MEIVVEGVRDGVGVFVGVCVADGVIELETLFEGVRLDDAPLEREAVGVTVGVGVMVVDADGVIDAELLGEPE